jgi:endonuclease/exonuclease/phosphatase family metal-dependent hydrolase
LHWGCLRPRWFPRAHTTGGTRGGCGLEDLCNKAVGDYNALPLHGKHLVRSRNIQHVLVASGDVRRAHIAPVRVCNFHGVWGAGQFGKEDTELRTAQSARLCEFLSRYRGEQLALGGDFNLNPDTHALKVLEAWGFRNLNKEFYRIPPPTRSPLYRKHGEEPYADYILISENLVGLYMERLARFAVLPDIVSDHYPLFVQIV